NPYNWIRGPYTAEQLKSTINARSSAKVEGSLMTLEVMERGPSDRVIRMKANGTPLVMPNPDAFRSALNGLPSTRFDVEETGRFTVLGAGGRRAEYPVSAAVLTAAGSKTSQSIKSNEFYVMNDAG